MTRARSLWPLYVAAFLATFQLSLANISIPDLRQSLHASPAQLSLVVGAFAATFAAGLITCGHLGDRYGRRRLFLLGLGALVVLTLVAAAAPGIGSLLVVRMLQGVASATMMPQILATVQSVLVGPERVTAIAVFSAASGVGTVAGQVVGGAIITAAPLGQGWRGAQLAGALVAVVALAGGFRLPETRSASAARIDLPGAALLGAGLLLLVSALSLGPASGWALWDDGLILLAVLLLALLARTQTVAGRRGRPAVLPPDVLAIPAVRTGVVMAVLFFGGFGAFMFNFSVLTQGQLGLSAFESGVAIGVFALAFVVTSVASTPLVRRYGARTMVGGAALQVVSLGLTIALSWSPLIPWVGWFQPIGVLLGAAQALMFAPLVGSVMQVVPDRVAGMTGGLVTTAQQAALGLGVAVLGGLFAQLSVGGSAVRAFGWVVVLQLLMSAAFGVLARRLDRRERSDRQTHEGRRGRSDALRPGPVSRESGRVGGEVRSVEM